MSGKAPSTAYVLGYLGAHFAKSQLWHASCLLFAFFLTEACGISPTAMGWVLGGSLAINGAVDLAFGWLSNGRIIGVRDAGRLQAVAAPVIALCFLLFALTPLLPAEWRLSWAIATLVGFRVFYPMLDVAQNALVVMMADDPVVQERLLAARNVASSLAALAVAVLAAPMLIAGEGPWRYILWSSISGSLSWLTAMWLANISNPDARPTASVTPRTRASPRPPAKPSFTAVLAALVLMMIAGTMFRTMESYLTAFASHRMELLIWSSIGAITGQPIWLVVFRRRGIVQALAGMAAALICAALLLSGSARTGSGGGLAIGLLYGMGSSGLWLVLWSMMTRGAVPGRTLRHVGTFTCLSKLSQAAGMVLVGSILSASHYDSTLADPTSLPSWAMIVALVAMAAVALGLAGYARVLSRRASGETARTPRPTGRSVPVPAPRPAAW